MLDFASERELVKQVGHPVDKSPLVVLKELTDNAIDAAEEAGIAPVIFIEVNKNKIIIDDRGGTRLTRVADFLNFSVRVSSREAYVSPTRGAQGNALKTIIAMPFALDGAEGETVIETQAVAHRINFKVDHVRHEPRVRPCSGSALYKEGHPYHSEMAHQDHGRAP